MSPLDRDPWIDSAIGSLPELDVPAELRRNVAQIPAQHQAWTFPTIFGLKSSWAWAICGALGLVCGLSLDGEDFAEAGSPTFAQEVEFGSDALDVNVADLADSASEQASLSTLAQLAWTSEWTDALDLTQDE